MPAPTDFAQLPWQSSFVDRLPGDSKAGGFSRQVRAAAYSEVQPTPVSKPTLLAWSEGLAAELGIARPTAQDSTALEILAGNRVLPAMRTYAARYGGHQFGNWAGQLGDGRAITLGEVPIPGHGRMEFQLKGAGPTPYSRRADGRAVLRSSIREFLCSEAMHFLGVPTTRALSLVSTGDDVIRDMFYDGNPKAEPGAIVCRVSPSFLRFGNFEILTANQEPELLKSLAQLLIRDHFPELNPEDPDLYGKLLDEVARRTARMITHWMRVGFVHGVMNTDNMSMLGLTIDYGPYGWLEPYEPNWTPNTTDAQGRRYCFGNQPRIALWNLERLCEAFLPLIPDEVRLRATLELYMSTFQQNYSQMFAQKLGIGSLESEDDEKLVHDLLSLLEASETDYTLFFRALCAWPADGDSSDENFLKLTSPAFYSSTAAQDASVRERWIRWSQSYFARIKQAGVPDEARHAEMKKVNPKYVLRNYLAQNAVVAAEKGDLSVLERLMRVLKTPYDEQPAEEDLARMRPEWARSAPGCSALSCSS